ncbi:MAG: hypothetical protein ACKORE_08875, partial [Bacteroidota bacterium]
FKALFIVLISALTMNTATAGSAETARFKEAEKLFVDKQYDKAMPLFAQLVSSSPKNYKYNYYYGICLLIQGTDKSKALPYLEASLDNSKTPEEVYYYMGRALHYNYRFDEAREYLAVFNEIVGPGEAHEWGTAQTIEMCRNAKRILDVTKNKELDKGVNASAFEYFDKYAFEQPQGKILSMPDDMASKTKSQSEERPTIFLSGNGRVMYYSAFVNESASRDIFRVEKNREGNWGAPVKVDRVVNTTSDEVFPTCNYDGRILYFSSRGHNSTGGYDVFKTVYSPMNKTWKKPVNMGSPVNSPDDDYSFVVSQDEKIAYFSTQRGSVPGTLTVHRIPYSVLDGLPIAVKGKVVCNANPELKAVRMIVEQAETGVPVIDMTSNANDGSFDLEFNTPGSYLITLETAEYGKVQHTVGITASSDGGYLDDLNIDGPEQRFAVYGPGKAGAQTVATTSSVNSKVHSSTNDAQRAQQVDVANSTAITNTGNPAVENSEASKNSTNQAPTTADNTGTVSFTATSSQAQPEVVYKVQIGAFKVLGTEVVKKRLEKMTDAKMLTSSKDKRWLKFYFGAEGDYSSARNLKSTLQQAGFKDAFVVAFQNGLQVPVQQIVAPQIVPAATADTTANDQ